MLCSLFSVFDPSCSNFFFESSTFKWFSMFLVLLLLWSYWLCPSGVILIIFQIIYFVKDFLLNIFASSYKHYFLMSVSLFLMLCVVGEFGMIPFMFTSSSHLVYNMSLSIPLWMSGVLFVFINSFMKAVSHMTPLGCPMVLVPFLVLIESISLLIRPFSLAVRLMANTMAGHMVMVLISGVGSLLSFQFFLIMPVLVGFMLFEFGVALVQGYVFMSLVLMYWSESN